MMNNGFHLSRLVARGLNQQDAIVEFRSGLNVIYGVSDTGKSYILECIKYMLGAEKPPESIPEDKEYDSLLLEIITHDNKTVTLQRSLKGGGDFNLYNTTLENISLESGPEKIRWKYVKDRSDSLPNILMDITKLSEVEVQTNQSGKTRPLHFSDLRHFTLIDESTVIDRRTPVWPSAQFLSRTVDEKIFNFFLSGEDASSLIEVPDQKIKKAEWNAKNELLEKMLEDLENDIGTSGEDVDEQLLKLENSIEIATETIADRKLEINDLLESRKEYWEEIQKSQGRLSVIQQLKERFRLLEEHYKSDQERLSFIYEADYYLSQLGGGNCPICGQLLEDHTSKQLLEDEAKALNVQEASRKEVMKLEMQLLDLSDTIESLNEEQEGLSRLVLDKQSEVSIINRKISENLEPDRSYTNEDVRIMLETRDRLLLLKEKKEYREFLIAEKDSLGDEPKKQRSKNTNVLSAGVIKARRQFSDALESRLKKWLFPNAGTVEFDLENDIVISGQARRSHGKGIRAIIHTAFTISLMTEFPSRHSHFVVSDSPLTSFKDIERVEFDEDIEHAFYKDLSSTSSEFQIIMLENKTPSDDIKEGINRIHFTGESMSGRSGFYPENKPSEDGADMDV